MGTGYVRNDTGNNIADGNVINASDLDGEFDAIVAAFNSSSGHTHDGTSEEGAPITKFGPSQEVEGDATALFPASDGATDLGKSTKEWKDLYIDGVINTDDMSADAATVTGNVSVGGTLNIGGAVDTESTMSVQSNASVGGTLAVTGDTDVSNLSASGTLDVAGSATFANNVTVNANLAVGDITASAIETGAPSTFSAKTTFTTDATVGGTFRVGGTTNLATANVTGTINVTGETTLDDVSANGTLDVSGNGSVGGTFNVEGDLKNNAGNLTIAATSYIVEVKGGGSTEGQIQLNCAANSHGQIIRSQPHSESVTNEMLLPKGANSTLVSEVGTATVTNKTLDGVVSISSTGTLNVAGETSLGNVSADGTLDASGNASVGGTLAVTGDTDVSNFSASGTFDVGGNASVGGTLAVTGDTDITNVSADGTLDVSGNASVGGTLAVTNTITGSSTVSDQDGDLRDIPLSTKVSGAYTLAIGDAGNQVTINSANVTVTIPTGVFSVGDIISIVSVNGCTATLACTAVNAIKAGDLAATASHTLDANGVASIMFTYTADLAVLTGNVSGVE
tara:strand:+ start:132 stop:1829 length:1698 start_codon:yes stop_codon:yes gene_type:complete